MIRLIISFIVAITILQLSLFFGVLFIALAIFAYKIKDKKFDVPQQPTDTENFDGFNLGIAKSDPQFGWLDHRE